MATKQLPDLSQKNTIGKYDFVLMRDTTTSTDKKITSKDFVESVGNPSVQGFSALMQQVTIDDTTINSITLTPSNNSTIYGYSDGMRISFRADIASADENELRIGDLDYVRIYDYGTTNDITYSQYDFVEAVYVTDHFERINNFKAGSFVYSNDYNAILYDEKLTYTDVYLTSAYGASKTEYYDGMVINFLSTQNTRRVETIDGTDIAVPYPVRISVDGLPKIDVVDGDFDSDLRYIQFNENEITQLYYKAGKFLRTKFKDVDDRAIEEESYEINPIDPADDEGLASLPEYAVISAYKKIHISIGPNPTNTYANLKAFYDDYNEKMRYWSEGEIDNVRFIVRIDKTLTVDDAYYKLLGPGSSISIGLTKATPWFCNHIIENGQPMTRLLFYSSNNTINIDTNNSVLAVTMFSGAETFKIGTTINLINSGGRSSYFILFAPYDSRVGALLLKDLVINNTELFTPGVDDQHSRIFCTPALGGREIPLDYLVNIQDCVIDGFDLPFVIAHHGWYAGKQVYMKNVRIKNYKNALYYSKTLNTTSAIYTEYSAVLSGAILQLVNCDFRVTDGGAVTNEEIYYKNRNDGDPNYKASGKIILDNYLGGIYNIDLTATHDGDYTPNNIGSLRIKNNSYYVAP